MAIAGLIEIARDLASTLDLDELLERIVRAAAEVSGSEAASILLYDNLTRQLYFQVATNLDEPTMRGLVVPAGGQHCRLGGHQPQIGARSPTRRKTRASSAMWIK